MHLEQVAAKVVDFGNYRSHRGRPHISCMGTDFPPGAAMHYRRIGDYVQTLIP
jgi:hypothetical protein